MFSKILSTNALRSSRSLSRRLKPRKIDQCLGDPILKVPKMSRSFCCMYSYLPFLISCSLTVPNSYNSVNKPLRSRLNTDWMVLLKFKPLQITGKDWSRHYNIVIIHIKYSTQLPKATFNIEQVKNKPYYYFLKKNHFFPSEFPTCWKASAGSGKKDRGLWEGARNPHRT